MLPAQLFLQEQAAPQDGSHAVGGDDGGGQRGLAAGEGVDVGQLTGGLKGRADVLGAFRLGQQLLLFDDDGVDEADDARDQKGQLVGDVGRILVQGFQHKIVGEGSRRVQNAVGNGQRQSQPGFCVLVIGSLLPGSAKVIVLVGLHKAKTDDTGTGEENGDVLGNRHFSGGAADNGNDGDQRTAGVADGGGDGQLNVAKSHIAQCHGADVQQGDRQVRPDDLPGNLYAADENLNGGMNAHDHAHGRDHFILTVFVGCVPAADLGKEIGTGPAQQSNNGKPKPTHFSTSISNL